MPVSTASAAFHITPVVIKTFLKHGKKKAKRLAQSEEYKEEPQDDIFFDQAFHIVKAFIDLGTQNTIESLQAFTNTRVPAPYWAADSPVVVPLSTCNAAADLLVDWFGPEELKQVVGGERWWQVRGLDGIDAEWICEEDDIKSQPVQKTYCGRKITAEESNILRMEKLETVMFYVHGGGYFWGSINTHRYQVLRYAHKMKSKAFTVNYRKAPQYPWPCALQDVIAAYLYLINPPPGALHKAISPKKIVFAGDSAGGGLCIAALTVLRDMGQPLPAGAALISPWVDLTHSFPSVMENTETDIIPKHGFLAKPSTLWPVPQEIPDSGRVCTASSNSAPKPGDTDTLKPRPERLAKREGHPEKNTKNSSATIETQSEMLSKAPTEDYLPFGKNSYNESQSVLKEAKPAGHTGSGGSNSLNKNDTDEDLDRWEPRPPKVLMKDPDAIPLELRSQIQMYAPTELLTHPLVSPVLQGSLGNLPPLYIIAGDGEALRDEVVYIAHKAANPAQYPARRGVLRDGRRQKDNAEKFTTPTKVHLQVFDGMCHVLTVFMFSKPARYAYRSIAEFAKRVTSSDEEDIANPFSQLKSLDDDEANAEDELDFQRERRHDKHGSRKETRHTTQEESKAGLQMVEPTSQAREGKENSSDTVVTKTESDGSGSTAVGTESSKSRQMLRERVDLQGSVRPMEPPEEIPALKIKPSEIGLIKEAPTLRWYEGQQIWDKRFANRTARILKKKAKYIAEAECVIKNALDQGLIHSSEENHLDKPIAIEKGHRRTGTGVIQVDRRWGPLDLQDERPPPSAIAARRDTPESLALLRKSIYHTAPTTHQTVPKMKVIDVMRAAFNPHDDPNKPPEQSVSEEQVKARMHILPVHGLRIWDDLVTYFGRKSAAKAGDGFNAAKEKTGLGTPA